MARHGLAVPLLAGAMALGGGTAGASTISLDKAFPIGVAGARVEVSIGGENYGHLDLIARSVINPDTGSLSEDLRPQEFRVYACVSGDGSVRELRERECDGSVNIEREMIDVVLSATANPTSTVGVTSVGNSGLLDIAVGFVQAWMLPFYPADVLLMGTYELEFVQRPADALVPLTLMPIPGHPGLDDNLLGLRPDYTGDAVVTHGADLYSLFFNTDLLAPQKETGDITSDFGTLLSTLGQNACMPDSCQPGVFVLAVRIDNPGGVERRAKVLATATYSPGTLGVIPLPAAGWLLLSGLGALGLLRRRR